MWPSTQTRDGGNIADSLPITVPFVRATQRFIQTWRSFKGQLHVVFMKSKLSHTDTTASNRVYTAELTPSSEFLCKVKVELSLYRPWRPLGLRDIRLTGVGKVVSPTCPGRFLVLISVMGWVHPRAIVRLEGKLKKSTSSWTRTGDLPACGISAWTNYATAYSQALLFTRQEPRRRYFLHTQTP
jgi:hypothetical protein